MRYPLLVSVFAFSGAALVASGCIQPEYPDEFDETIVPATSDASQAVVAPDAATGVMPNQTQNPLNPLLPVKPGTDAGNSRPLDAGVAAVDANAAPLDTGLGRDARADAAPAEEEAGSVTSPSDGPTQCTITASTDANDTLFYFGKYGCAVWISSGSNKLVKAFFVATKVASRTGLNTYRNESTGATVDVVTGATLGSAKQHQYTWTLTDTQGAKVAPGKYALKVEIHSSNGEELLSVPFDTTSAPVSEMGSSGQIRSASIECQ